MKKLLLNQMELVEGGIKISPAGCFASGFLMVTYTIPVIGNLAGTYFGACLTYSK